MTTGHRVILAHGRAVPTFINRLHVRVSNTPRDIGHAARVEILWFVLTIVGCGLLLWFAVHIEPHWVSKDGNRFLCSAQRLTGHGEPESRWRETRLLVTSGNQLQVDQKRLLRRMSSFWKVASRSDDPPRGKEIFLLTGFDESGKAVMLAVRLPKKSRAVETLDKMMKRR